MSEREANMAYPAPNDLATRIGYVIGDVLTVVFLVALAFGCSGLWHQ